GDAAPVRSCFHTGTPAPVTSFPSSASARVPYWPPGASTGPLLAPCSRRTPAGQGGDRLVGRAGDGRQPISDGLLGERGKRLEQGLVGALESRAGRLVGAAPGRREGEHVGAAVVRMVVPADVPTALHGPDVVGRGGDRHAELAGHRGHGDRR